MARNEIPKICICLGPRNGIPSCVLFRRRVRNRIMGVYFYFCSSERNSEVVFSSAEGFGTEFRDFLFRGITGIPSEITICSVYSVFRGIIFLSEIPNPKYTWTYLGNRSMCWSGHVYTIWTRAAPGHIYTTGARAAPVLVWTKGFYAALDTFTL